MAERIASYKQLVDRYIPEQYKTSERLRGVLDFLMVQADALEAAFWEIFESLNLETAVGPALDFFGAIFGVERKPGETDEAYRDRIYKFRSLLNASTYEGVRKMLEFFTGQQHIDLFPCWPAGFYWVPPHAEEYNLAQIISEFVPSGVDIGLGTFLVAEYGEPYGLVVSEDTGMPFVIDQEWPEQVEYAMVNDEDNLITNSSDEVVIGTDYF